MALKQINQRPDRDTIIPVSKHSLPSEIFTILSQFFYFNFSSQFLSFEAVRLVRGWEKVFFSFGVEV